MSSYSCGNILTGESLCAGWHRSKALPVAERMRLEPLPAYTPETNPVEHIWDEIREKCVASRLFATFDAVKESTRTGIEELSLDKPRLGGIIPSCIQTFNPKPAIERKDL